MRVVLLRPPVDPVARPALARVYVALRVPPAHAPGARLDGIPEGVDERLEGVLRQQIALDEVAIGLEELDLLGGELHLVRPHRVPGQGTR